ncbi:hypothetical protein PVAP13_4KG399651 [Panicum virgatum]|uniref:Endonuclease/exonuclease/phosphatase domain-containing protein n=1 Tax=Panicum virgatum TaxID=38727 RepID=A0A8T0TNP1_PANVG|nr:hypothetical protein PVAP13_4KG399651 [Panicum virgatum]
MKGLFWNIRGLNKLGRVPALTSKIRDNHVDLVGVLETKKECFTPGFLRSLTGNTPFNWCHQPARGSAGGILLGVNSDLFVLTVGDILHFSISAMVMDKKTGFSWKIIVVYGSPYEDGKQDFIDELHHVMGTWSGPIIIGGDFNLVRFSTDKSNQNISHRWADAFNEWISKWGLLELDPSNKLYTWTNNQENVVLARIDRIFISTDWEAAFPMARVKALERPPSDHNPLLLDSGDNIFFGKKKFRFEKWWLHRDSFGKVIQKAWGAPCNDYSSLDIWQFRIRTLRRMIRGWASNEVAALNKQKNDLATEYNSLDNEAE